MLNGYKQRGNLSAKTESPVSLRFSLKTMSNRIASAPIVPCQFPTSKRFIDLSGKRFSRLKAVSYYGKRTEPSGAHANFWKCVCDCGTESLASTSNLASRHTTSCGCFHLEQTRLVGLAAKKHGRSYSSEYRTWANLKDRCMNPNSKGFKGYGGRGITVCDRWSIFENFFIDMGARPTPNHSIERVDNNLGYSKDNCVWATRKQQQRNRRNTRLITFNGETLCLSAWAEKQRLSPCRIHTRLDYFGWSIERALTEPVRMLKKTKH